MPEGYYRGQSGPNAHTFEFHFKREYRYDELVIEILLKDRHARIFTTFDPVEYETFVQTGFTPKEVEHPVISLVKPISVTVVCSEEFTRKLETVLPSDDIWKVAVKYRFAGYAGFKDGDYVLLMRRKNPAGGYF